MIDVPATAGTPVTVFAHAHYPDIWRDMSSVLSNRLTVPFRLFVTSALPRDAIVMPRSPHLCAARFLQVENRGRDILPFLRAMAIAEPFDIGLKLHTKRSPQREDGPQWRAALLASLIPPDGSVDRIVGRMRADHRIGVVAPADFCLSVRPWVLNNEPNMRRIMSALGADMTEEGVLEDAFFAAGSMFWFRRAALAALAGPELSALFEPERGQLDGTTAHAMERLFPVEARRQGYVSLAVPALLASRPDMPIDELRRLARCHADAPTRYFPGPNIPALPLRPGRIRPSFWRWWPWVAAAYRAALPNVVRRWLRRVLRRAPTS
jgi:lipopolysaccharide biosynthesis protein